MLKFFTRKKSNILESRFQFYTSGFHGDLYLMAFADIFLKQSDYFIETGSNVGSTLAYVARTYPKIQCISCEPDKKAYEQAVKNTSGYSNVSLYNMTSQELIRILKSDEKLFDKDVFFWLDAHGYGFDWPLKDEISFITHNFKRAYILIDDFKVPGLDCFKWDKSGGQECSFDFIKNSIKKELNLSLYYPNYTETTSKHHPLTGWGLIMFGQDKEPEIPENIKNNIRKAL